MQFHRQTGTISKYSYSLAKSYFAKETPLESGDTILGLRPDSSKFQLKLISAAYKC